MSANNDKGYDTLKLMLGYLCVATEIESSLPRKVEILDRFGLTDKDIAKICSCSTPSIANARLSLRKKKAKIG
ncbi:MAG: hypothetical protein ACHQQQ_12040 [Bacteroidota bacterium]